MGFLKPCFIRKNTPELRKKLEELGYRPEPNGHGVWFIPMDELYYLVTFPESHSYMGTNGYWYKTDFDCGTNEELFLALAALRDDTDKNQWFICIKDLETAFESFYVGDFILCKIDKFPKSEEGYFRKATIEEIIEHFKDK